MIEPIVTSINISPGGIPKRPMLSVFVSHVGLQGDGHNHEKHNTPFQAVCLQDEERLEELRKEGYPVFPGTTGENLTVRNLNVNALPLGTVLEFSGGLVLEISKVRKPCYVLDAIHPKIKDVIVGRCGCYAQVLQEAWLSVGETVQTAKSAVI